MATVSSRDIHEIVSKLSSDKAKIREEGMKLLNTWLGGERSINFCRILSRKTAMLRPDEIPGPETWPFLVTLLIDCINKEILASKRRLPKLMFAKTLRIVVQRAQDSKSYGNNLPLIAAVKSLYNHIWDVLKDVPSFHSEYSIILRHILAVHDYCFHMRNRVYSGLVRLYMEKVEPSVMEEDYCHSNNPKEEVFRCILTLHSLIENPPGDFPDHLREKVVEFFIEIFKSMREVGRVSRKLIECLNSYLLKDGPNLGRQSLDVHKSVKRFVFDNWHIADRDLKDGFILYMKLQLHLMRVNEDEEDKDKDGIPLVEQLLELLSKELDQYSIPSVSASRSDTSKDEKFGMLASSHRSLLELAALVFYRACVGVIKRPVAEKRARRENAAAYLQEQLTRGKWLWHAVFCHLCHSHQSRLPKELLAYWFDGICSSLERILSDANVEHSYDGLLWTLRSLHHLSIVLLPLVSVEKDPLESSSISNKIFRGWQTVWSCLVHGFPKLSSITSVADAAFRLLGYLVSHDMLNMTEVPQDVWDLQCFRCISSPSALYFISCYFSRKGSQGDLRDNLYLRQNILRGVMSIINTRETLILDEHVVILLPAALYAICVGVSIIKDHCGGFSSYCDDEAAGKEVDWLRVIYGDQQKHEESDEYFDCFVHTLAEINFDQQDKVLLSCNSRGVRLPRQLRDPLTNEMENCILYDLLDKKTEKNLSDIFLRCSLLSNILYGSVLTRQKDEISPFRAKLGNCLSGLIESAVEIVQGSVKDVKTHSFWSSNPSLDGTSSVVCFKSFLSCPIFSDVGKEIAVDPVFRSSFVLCIERLLKAFSNLYLEFSIGDQNLQSETISPEVSSFSSSGDKPFSLEGSKSRLIDMELDVADESSDVIDGTTGAGNFLTGSKLKVDTLSLMASCFSVLPMATWDILFEILSSERDSKVCERILYSLCQSPHWSSLAKLTNLVALVDEILELKLSLRLPCVDVLTTICCLLATLLYWRCNGKDEDGFQSMKERFDEKSLLPLGDLLIKVAESNLLDWFGRRKLVDCICDFIRLNPLIGQTMIQRLFILLKDPDYRVRFILARRIGILFLTWDGHDVLFQDICSNFGPKLIMCSKEKVVTEKEVWPDDYASHPIMETIVITLMHAAFHSEKVESEAIFMICVISAIGCCQRQLVKTVLDNLARKLHYACRSKYLEELMGPILFSWVACGMSLFAFVQIMDLFGLDVEQNHFLLFCCPWLLPALVLHGDSANLQCLAELTRQSVPVLVRSHFVPVFSICMVLYCSKMAGWEKGSAALQSKILHFAEISEDERDMLIKKHMVTIVCQILSLASSASDTMVPLFSRKIVELAVRTVVDGFMELDNHSSIEGVVDKINVFRPDRVFMLLVELHYKVTAAVHERHRSHRLAGIEVLISILGHRVAVPSTSCYLFNLVGQLISSPALQDQCCHMISILLKMFKTNPSRETTHILGEQLQFLVSKLVACCIPLGSNTDNSCTPSSQVLSLLHLLTVDSDPSLHDYIREFEPFPELEIFDRIRIFHLELCKDYSPRDHFLKFVKRSCHLPPRLLLWSLQAFHRKLLGGESFCVEEIAGSKSIDNCWQSDLEIVQAVWSLVRICGSQDADARALVSDLISKVGIGDPRSVVFHLPGNLRHVHVCGASDGNYATVMNFELDAVTSEELLIALIRNLKKYLMDDSVKIVDLSSRTLRGLLSTERGNRILGSFESYERSLIEVHSKGFNMQLVESILLDLQKKFTAEGRSLEESSLWKTSDKMFESWICPLVYSLIGHCSDITLRLCQDIVLLKAEIAELLLPSIMINLAGRKDLATDFCHLISVKVEQHILVETNNLTKSIQVMLEVLNELRLCHVMERASTGSISNKQESSKASRSSSAQGAKSRASMKAQGSSTALWHKVYWLNVDYLTVAKLAILCGSYFTAMLYVEHWCEDHFKNLTLGKPDFSHVETLPKHIELLLSALTQINEPDGLYGIIQSHKLTSQILTFEHEGNWSKALKYYDLQVRLDSLENYPKYSTDESCRATSSVSLSEAELGVKQRKPYKGVIKSLQQIGCAHTLDLYCQGLASCRGEFQHDLEFVELQYEAAWRSGNWDFSMFNIGDTSIASNQFSRSDRFNQNLHSCLRALQEGDSREYYKELKDSKQELALSLYHASEESTEYIYSTIVKLQILDHLGMTWDLRWRPMCNSTSSWQDKCNVLSEPTFPVLDELSSLNAQWKYIVKQTQLHMNLLEPFVAFRKVLLQILGCKDCTVQHLLQSSSVLRKGTMFSQAAASLHEFKFMCMELGGQNTSLYWHGRLEEAKLLRAQGRQEMAINLAKYIAEENQSNEDASDVHRLVGKWLAETRSSNSRTILEKYLKRAVTFAEELKAFNRKSVDKKCQAHFHLAHYADALFRSHEERLNSSEWQAGLRLRKHKKMELEALIKRFRSSTKGEKTDYSLKIQDLQKQLALDTEVAEKLQDDRDKFLNLALDGYKYCLILGEKYDVRVVFRLVSIWFGLSSRQNVIKAMVNTVNEVQSYKFIPLVYQIASRMGSTKEVQGPHSFQFALASLVKKMAIEHPYHTLLQLLALANGDRIKDKQRSRNSYVVDVDKKVAAENLLKELLSHHGNVIRQMKQLVEIYIRLAELETKREDTNRKVGLPRDIRSVRELELVPVLTSNVSVDRSCQYSEGTFPYFKGLGDSVVVMNGINAPKVVECYGSDGKIYRQLAKSGNDDLRQDAVMEQFFGLVNTFLYNNQDTWKRKLGVRTYKVVPFTPSAGIIEWVDGTLPLGEYLIGSSRNGGAHGRYGAGDWPFSKCREHMMNVKDKRKAFQEVSENFRPVMHFFFLERFLQPADWFEKRLAYTRSVAASSMVGYIVGLGDRHSMNILIDQATAEVVHIDLGVAFEQGLMLKTPERVPFRLTRDIIDGMGVTGVEGVFRRCCEETLAVMRTNKEALLTIIEVFIHDPLYKWALSPLKALQRQKETDEDLETSWEDSQDECEGNKDAARALMRVKQKLDGYEDGEMRSVHGQVQQLIQDAIDPERLCNMFPGWGAWM
ncbi:serine/threonine-protein kinase ATM-like isoform X2 [Chenopodium quinoa]|uniref:serine/threonine-protein kinase ATM-like isoform X2 n=1 Tax=Chenopodium quinoa TaxID=63459 RepID=UPI000B780B27|nr:serine/threonine-protein kinase ATM-like isoform X2 [Chenopodium quinoa]